MSSSDVTRGGIEGRRPDVDAVTGAEGRGVRRRGRGRGEVAMVPRAEFESYYGKPVLNPPVWTSTIPAYFFTGGLAAGSSLLALGADVTGNTALRRQCRFTSFGALLVSTGLLVEDLGKPARFHHMLRVFKVTSPMSIGSWILTLYAPGATGAALSEYTGLLPRLGSLAGLWAAVMAPPLGAYTAPIVAQTAVPVWHKERLHLPFAFVGSAMAAAGGMAMATNDPGDARPARRLALLGAAVETLGARLGRRHAGEIGDVYDEGKAGRLRRASEVCTAAGAASALLFGRRRAGAVAGGVLLMAGSLFERFSVFHAGMASAVDPKYTVKPQRQRVLERGPERTGPKPVPHITTAQDVISG